MAFERLFHSMSLYFRDLKSFARSFEHFIKRGLACFQLPSSARMMKTIFPRPRVYASIICLNGFFTASCQCGFKIVLAILLKEKRITVNRDLF